MSLKIEIDRNRCSGSGECTFRAPHTFSLGDENTAEVAASPGDDEAAILAAARGCPCFAISIRPAAARGGPS